MQLFEQFLETWNRYSVLNCDKTIAPAAPALSKPPATRWGPAVGRRADVSGG